MSFRPLVVSSMAAAAANLMFTRSFAEDYFRLAAIADYFAVELVLRLSLVYFLVASAQLI